MIIDLTQIPIFWYGGIKPHRKEKLLQTFRRLNLNTTFVEPFISNDPKSAVRIGCSLSHLKTLEMILDIKGPVLVLEDDARETEWYASKFEIPDDTDAFYLGTCLNGIHKNWQNMGPDGGCCSDPICLEKYDNYYRIHGMLTTHAILYCSDKYKVDCRNLLKESNGNKFLDVLFASKMQDYRVYAARKPLFFQDCEKDNYDAYIKTITPLQNLFH